jgi:hypothetical protein
MRGILLIIVGVVVTTPTKAEDCLDRQDDRYAHEYYTNSYEANKERRRHSNDICNNAYADRMALKEATRVSQLLKILEQSRLEEQAAVEKASKLNALEAAKLREMMLGN